MLYFLDGYNLLFTLTESNRSVSEQRQKIIRFLQKKFSAFKMEGILVFDGRVRHEEESGRSYPNPLEVVYTSKNQSADEFIVEKIEAFPNPKQITVVTNDRGLMVHVRSLGAKTVSNADFIQWLMTRRKKSLSIKPEAVDSKQNIDRLLAIFERRLKDEN